MGMHQMLGPIGGGASDYVIERSLRFNPADSANLTRTFSSGNRRTFTLSYWIKECGKGLSPSNNPHILWSGPDVNTRGGIVHRGTGSDAGELYIFNQNSGTTNCQVWTNSLHRDFGAWKHIIWAIDTTQSTATYRVRVYINGVEETLNFATTPAQNLELQINVNQEHRIGRGTPDDYGNYYLAETHFIDGQQLTPTSFGEYDDDNNWIPKRFTGTYGTNGFFLNFEDATNTTTIAEDSSGNSNDFTANNFSVTAGKTNDSLLDSPSNGSQSDTGAGGEVSGNWAVWNPVSSRGFDNTSSLKNGNLDVQNTTTTYDNLVATCGMPSNTGSYYWEFEVTNNSGNFHIGVAKTSANLDGSVFVGGVAGTWGFGNSGYRWSEGTYATGGAGFATNGMIVSIVFNSNTGVMSLYRNGTLDVSITGITDNAIYMPAVYTRSSGGASFNFGQRPFQQSGAVPSGAKLLCSALLSAPAIAEGSQHFDAKLWTGNSSNNRTIDGYNFSPDLVYIKRRSASYGGIMMDTVRGLNNGHAGTLYTNSTAAEDTGSTSSILSFNSDGFNLGTDGGINYSGSTYVGWAWDAGSSTSTNYDGSINSQVRVNQSAGFSIIAYTGNGSSSASTVGHGLGAVPDLLIIKSRGTSYSWIVWHNSFTAKQLLYLNHNYAIQNNKDDHFANTLPTNQVFSLRESPAVNSNGTNFICYAFSMIPGYSATGTYDGNGSDTRGPFIYLGFRPAFLMIKSYSHSENWVIYDSERGPINAVNNVLRPNMDNAETATDERKIDFLSNGFNIRGTSGANNAASKSYFYVAFAEHPFKTARAR